MTADSLFEKSTFQFPPVTKTRLVVSDIWDTDTWQYVVRTEEFDEGYAVWHEQGGDYGFFYGLETEDDAKQLMCYFKSLGQRAMLYKDAAPVGNTWDGHYMRKTIGGYSFLQSRE